MARNQLYVWKQVVKHKGTTGNIPLAFGQTAHFLHPVICCHKTMVSTKLFKMQIIAIVKATQSVFVQLSKVIGLSERVIGKLPVKCFLYGRSPNSDLSLHIKGGKLLRQRAEERVYVDLSLGIRMDP